MSALVVAGSVVGAVGIAATTAGTAGASPVLHSHHARGLHGLGQDSRAGGHLAGRGSHLVLPSKWSIVPSPSATGKNSLYGVSCTSVSFCMAAGVVSTVGPGFDQTLIEKWDGTTWSILPSPNVEPTASVGTDLDNVSCVTASFCLAVGYSYSEVGPDTTVIDKWNGSTWSAVSSPNPTQPGGNDLYGISCTSLTFCMATGESYTDIGKPLVTTFDGSTWKLVPTTDSTTGDESWLNQVSCTTPSFCLAVGVRYDGNDDQTFSQVWRGATMTDVTIPIASGSTGGEGNSVSCVSSTFCALAGDEFNDSSAESNLTNIWNGSSWSAAAPLRLDGGDSSLDGIACTGTTSCTAVGYLYTTGSNYVTSTDNWNGTTWTVEPGANPPVDTPGSDYAELEGVYCLAGQLCVAVGEAFAGDNTQQTTLIETTPIPRSGYRLVASDGGVFAFGASFNGSTGSIALNKPIVGMAATPDGGGYWLVASDGGVFSFGDASFFGSTGSLTLNAPIVGMASTPNGGGYWLVASDGGIFAFGNANFLGSTGATALNKPIVGMAATPSGQGYWLVAADGGIFTFGDATYEGSTGSTALNKPIVGMAASPTGLGYRLVASDGGIFAFGDSSYYGSTGGKTLNAPVVGMASSPDGKGYWLVGSDGGIFSFGDAIYAGSTGSLILNRPIVGMAS